MSGSPKEKDFVDKVVSGFMRKAFLTDATLFLASPVNPYSERPYSLIYQTLRGQSCRIQSIYVDNISMPQLIPQVDFYIAGNNPDEWLYMQTALSNNVPIIGTVETEDEMFADIPQIEQVEQWKNFIQPRVVELFKTYPPSEYEYFLFHLGLGESLCFFYWLKEYRKISKKKILLFCVSDSHISLMNLSPYIDMTIKVPPVVFDYLYIFCSKDYGIKNFCELYNTERSLRGRIARVAYAEVHAIGVAQDYLRIPPHIKFSRYDVQLPEQSIANAQKIFNDMGLVRGRTIFMVTEGISQFLHHHKDFWVKLVRRLREKNFEVVTNSPTPIIPDCKNVFLPLADSSAFVGLCGKIISTTTGFTEAICSVNVKDKIQLKTVTYSQNDTKGISFGVVTDNLRYYGRKLFEDQMYQFSEYMKLMMPPNVNYSMERFGNNPEEDDAVIEKIVAEILENTKS